MSVLHWRLKLSRASRSPTRKVLTIKGVIGDCLFTYLKQNLTILKRNISVLGFCLRKNLQRDIERSGTEDSRSNSQSDNPTKNKVLETSTHLLGTKLSYIFDRLLIKHNHTNNKNNFLALSYYLYNVGYIHIICKITK